MNINATSYALVTITMDEVGLYTLINAVISAIQHAEDWNFDDEYDIDTTPYHELATSLKEKYESVYGKFE